MTGLIGKVSRVYDAILRPDNLVRASHAFGQDDRYVRLGIPSHRMHDVTDVPIRDEPVTCA